MWFRVRAWVIPNPHPKYQVSPEPKSKPNKLGFSPVDSSVGAGGPYGFGFDCHPYIAPLTKKIISKEITK
jgi:hypothetical protein